MGSPPLECRSQDLNHLPTKHQLISHLSPYTSMNTNTPCFSGTSHTHATRIGPVSFHSCLPPDPPGQPSSVDCPVIRFLQLQPQKQLEVTEESGHFSKGRMVKLGWDSLDSIYTLPPSVSWHFSFHGPEKAPLSNYTFQY